MRPQGYVDTRRPSPNEAAICRVVLCAHHGSRRIELCTGAEASRLHSCYGRDAPQTGPRGLAAVGPDVRLEALQSVDGGESGQRASVAAGLGPGHEAGYQPEQSDRPQRRDVPGPRHLQHSQRHAGAGRRNGRSDLGVPARITRGRREISSDRTGKLVWETKTADYKTGVTHSSAPAVIKGKVISGRTCGWRTRCFIVAHDAETGKELWRVWTAALPGTPEDATWGGLPLEQRTHISPWGAPGSYDPSTGLYYVGTAVPGPYSRIARHNGNPDAVPRATPAELYSNSTLAIDIETGKIVWYFQHLPGDDWDADVIQERILIDTVVNPNRQWVDWINPSVLGGTETRKIVVTLGEPGGLWALDRQTGKFLWASAFPQFVPEFHLSYVAPETGQAFINWDRVHKRWGEKVTVCYHNVKGWYPMSYSPVTNYLYIPWNDNCLNQTSNPDRPDGTGPRGGGPRPGSDPNKMGNLTAVDVATGKHVGRISQPAQTLGGTLATATNLVFWGDRNRRFRALDAETGKVLWETMLGDNISNGPITYTVHGRQYIAQIAGNAGSGPAIGANVIYVF